MANRNVDLLVRARDGASVTFKKVAAAVKELSGIQAEASEGAERFSTSLGRTKKTAAEQTAALARAQAAYDKIGTAVDGARQSLSRQSAALREDQARLDALRAEAREAAAAVERLKNSFIGPRQPGDGMFAQQEKAITDLNREIARLAPAVRRGERALEESTDELRRVESAAGAAEVAMRGMRQESIRASEAQDRLNARRAAVVESRRNRLNVNPSQPATGFAGLVEAERRIARASDERARAARDAAVASLEGANQQARVTEAFRRGAAAARAYQPSIRRATQALRGFNRETGSAARGARQVAGEMLNARRAFRAFYGDSRQALSFMQRIRGEFLSLAASAIGFYGVFRQGSEVLRAFQDLEAAQTRLGAAFQQDANLTAAELDRLAQEADRLGISFNVLADNFSKFLISGQQAGLQTEQLRTIFRQVSEAGRVLKLSNDQIAGTFTALTQIAGKGTLQMEELRQQLGDRLPGAVGLVAQGLGFASDELADFYDAVENGRVGAEEALLALGNQLEATYGAQLSDALDNTSAKLGSLQNNLFERRITAANAGFIGAINSAIDSLNEFLESDEGIEFFEAIGRAAGDVVDVLPLLLENLDKIILAFKVFIALKMGQVVAGIGARFTALFSSSFATRRALVALLQATNALSPSLGAVAASSTRAGVALRAFGAVVTRVFTLLRAALASFGGVVGIAAAALTFFAFNALGGVSAQAEEANRALREHEEVVSDVTRAYREAEGDMKKFQANLEEIDAVAARTSLRQLKDSLDDLTGSSANARNSRLRRLADELQTARQLPLSVRTFVSQLEREFARGEISAGDFAERISRIFRDYEADIPADAVEDFVEWREEVEELSDAIEKNEAIIALQAGTATDAQKELLGLAEAVEEVKTAAELAEEKNQAFSDALRELAENVPEMNEKFERLDAVQKIEEDFRKAIDAANELPNAAARSAAALQAIDFRNQSLESLFAGDVSQFTGTDAVSVTADLLREFEGFRETPYWDVNALRAGYGSDTVTLDDGSIRRVVEGTRVSRADAERDLFRRIETEFLPRAREQVGAARFDTFTPQQQAALASIAYNYGELPNRILGALRTGTTREAAAAIRRLGADNDGINRDRRFQEAALFETSPGAGEAAASQVERERQERQRAAERRAEDQREYNAGIQQELENQQFLQSIEGQRLIQRETAKALREAELEAEEKGLTLTQAQRDAIRQRVQLQFQQQQADEDRNALLERARKQEQVVNDLMEERAFLVERQEFAEGQGNTSDAAQAAEDIREVDAALEEATAKAIEFWSAVGGPEGDRAIANLNRAQERVQRLENQVVVSGEQINQMIAGRVSQAFNNFAQRVAAGEDAFKVFKEEALAALADVILQIGQAIIQQAVLNALTGGVGGDGGGGVGGFIASGVNALVRHGGGMADGSGPHRMVDPSVFANALRYHSGGLPGLKSNEVATILENTEEVLTRDDPRHVLNGGGQGEKMPTIINAFDAPDMLDQALATSPGERAILNFVSKNRGKVNAALSGSG